MVVPTDPLYASQWHLTLLGNIQKIWNEFDGTGVHVGVYDDGLQYTHPDLNNNYDASLEFQYNGVTYRPTPLTADDAHGTACAGLIAGEAGNGIGGVGVAFGAMLTGVNYLGDIQFQSAAIYDAAMLWGANFDIVSNSWGMDVNFDASQDLTQLSSFASMDVALWDVIASTGRGGLGTIIVKAAGNETVNVNGDGWNSSRLTITVAATDLNGDVADYSNYGAAVLVAGPAAAVTTDLVGQDGYNVSGGADGDTLADTNYQSQFNGTSAATPVVAGVVALMLDANANLGWRDVQNLLALSASHTGSSLSQVSGTGFEFGGWLQLGGNTWNAGGQIYHESYGYGMVNAYGAVRLAEAWATIKPVAFTSANELTEHVSYSGPSVNIPDATASTHGKATIHLIETTAITIESIAITVTATHGWAGDLAMWLVTPDGEKVQILAPNDLTGAISNTPWTFTVDGLRGYSSAGDWKLLVEDTDALLSGSIQDVEMDFFGSARNTNSVFTFTNDFLMLRGADATRSLTDDLDGGSADWVNFAAVEGSARISLAASGAMRVNNVLWSTLASGSAEIENAMMGDGHDYVLGNALANRLYGMRGNDSMLGADGIDRLTGGTGNDSLDGGTGNDILNGGTGNDILKGGVGNDDLTGSSGNDQYFGDAGNDNFIFAKSSGTDRVSAFADNIDTLMFDDAIWGGGKTVAQVISTFAHVVGGTVVFDFGGINKITIVGINNLTLLQNDLTLF